MVIQKLIHLCREASEVKLSWDPTSPGDCKTIDKMEDNAPDGVYFPRSLVQYQEPINNIKLHEFVHKYTSIRCDTGSDCRQIPPCREKSEDSLFGAHVGPNGSQLVNKCAGCTIRLQYDRG